MARRRDLDALVVDDLPRIRDEFPDDRGNRRPIDCQPCGDPDAPHQSWNANRYLPFGSMSFGTGFPASTST